MKSTVLLLILFQLFSCNNKRDTTLSSVHPDSIQFGGLNLFLDSGFIDKQHGMKFLLSHSSADTTDSNWSLIKVNDAICKYYKVNGSANYLMCFIDFVKNYDFVTNFVIEVTPNGKVIKNERFSHANHPCCLLNYFEGFKKYQEYFGMKVCGSGTGYCGSYLYLFKELLPQDSLKTIPLQYNSSSLDLSQNLTSTMEFQNGMLTMHYKLSYCEKDGTSRLPTWKTDVFDVKYLFINKRFSTRDSAKFENLDVTNFK